MTSSNPESTSPNQTPTAEQLAAARANHWHQNAEPLLTIEALREWLQRSGLVLYTPRALQLPSPAPSFVEATLGAVNTEPALTDIEQARGLLARLISEGVAVPLNLLGVTGGTGTDVPDFVVSAQVFSYIFTLRGNKAWKQPPLTSGAVKVSPLAAAAYEILTAKISLSAYDLTTQLGKEVTEAAVLRALTELWSQLRVIPVPQIDGTATLWELTSTRFTKQIKSGANAGQPTALSALISLYLGQALVATEDEIETFLSPLAPRSRLRDVIHALLSARQLETIVVDGKTLLYVTGDLPVFAAIAKPEGEVAAAEPTEPALAEDGTRIRKFTPKPGSKIGTGLRSKPAFGAKPAFGRKPAFGAKPAFGDRERRPFDRDARPSRPTFNKPWEEDRKPRPAAPDSFAASSEGDETERPAYTPRPSRPSFGNKPAYGSKPSFGRKPAFGSKPRFEGNREGGEGRSDRPAYTPRPFTPREGSDSGPRKTFSKPGTFGRKREGFAGKPSFGSDQARPPRRDFQAGEGRPERPAGGGFKRPFTPREGGFGSSDRGERPTRPGFGAKPGFSKPSFSKPSFSRDRGDQGASSEGAPKRVYRKFDAPRAPKPFGSKPFDRQSSGGDRPSRPFSDRPSRPFTDRPSRPFDADRPRPEGRPSSGSKSGGFGAKKPFGSKPGGFSKAGGPFAKFADGKKPFRKPGPGKPAGGKSSFKPGGFKPTKRREGGA